MREDLTRPSLAGRRLHQRVLSRLGARVVSGAADWAGRRVRPGVLCPRARFPGWGVLLWPSGLIGESAVSDIIREQRTALRFMREGRFTVVRTVFEKI